MNFLAKLEEQSKTSRIFLALALIGLIGILDLLTGYELAFSLFYVIPIAFATWSIDQRHGIMASLVSALVWVGADVASGHVYLHPTVPIWNTLIRLSFFIIIAFLLSELKSSMDRERELARTDYLTGAVNARLFFELLQMEINRLQRYDHIFTLAYIDLDNFKAINDQFGHHSGDQVLCTVVSYAKKHIRKMDLIARLGGDEFALLLPETNQESARVVLAKLQSGLLEEMQQHNWSITFSIGALTCNGASLRTDELVQKADELMYSVKRSGKNAINYSTYPGEPPLETDQQT